AAHGARFGFPEIKLGVFPPVAAVGLRRAVGAHRASELILTGRTIDAVEAERIGLVNKLVPDAGLGAAVEATVNDFLALSGSGLRAAKRALRIGRPQPTPDEIAAAEALYLDDLLHDANAIEGLRAFMEKRAPRWDGR